MLALDLTPFRRGARIPRWIEALYRTSARRDLHTSLILRTVLGLIFNFAALSRLRRQRVNVAFHPGGSARCTCDAASRRGVAAAQNSDWPSLVALTT